MALKHIVYVHNFVYNYSEYEQEFTFSSHFFQNISGLYCYLMVYTFFSTTFIHLVFRENRESNFGRESLSLVNTLIYIGSHKNLYHMILEFTSVEAEGLLCMFLAFRDTAGQERFRTITTAYYRGAMVRQM